MEELEQYLCPTDYNEEIPSDVSLLIDFMSFVRSQVISHVQFTSFGQLSDALFMRCLNLTKNQLTLITLDSYRHDSLKGPERDRRGSSSIELAKITRGTPIPRQSTSSGHLPITKSFAKFHLSTVPRICQENEVQYYFEWNSSRSRRKTMSKIHL